MSDEVEPYYYARNHDKGAGMWCVRGPNGFQMEVPDKLLAYAIGKLLSGKSDDAVKAAADWRQYADNPWPRCMPS